MVRLCRHVKQDGVRCQSPAMRPEEYCYHHLRYKGVRLWTGGLLLRGHWKLRLPVLDTLANVRTGEVRVQWAEDAGLLPASDARLLSYGLRIVVGNLRWMDEMDRQR